MFLFRYFLELCSELSASLFQRSKGIKKDFLRIFFSRLNKNHHIARLRVLKVIPGNGNVIIVPELFCNEIWQCMHFSDQLKLQPMLVMLENVDFHNQESSFPLFKAFYSLLERKRDLHNIFKSG